MPEFTVTYGPEVAEAAELAGFIPDPEQRLLLDAMFALSPDRSTALVRDFGIVSPRQCLKTGTLKMAALGWLYITEQRLIVWSAHEFSTAQEAFRDICQLIESCPDLDAEVKMIHRGNGEEAIELTRDRRLRFKARTKVGGRGLTGDKVVLDEAMYLTPTHMGALVPTLRAVRDPQLVLAGSAGMRESATWRDYRGRGRAGGDRSLGWFEWADPNPNTGCATTGCDHHRTRTGCALDDRARWWACNTALGRRISEDTIDSDRRNMSAAEFARETLGWWEDPPGGGGIIDLDHWATLLRQVPTPSAPALAVEVTADRSRTVIGAAWQVEGRPHVEVVAEATGLDWVAAKLADLAGKYGSTTVALDSGTAAWDLAEQAERAGLNVVKVAGAQRASACGTFYDAATSAQLSHNGDPAIASALAAARWKDVGEGARVFTRRGSTADISPLYAVTLALHALTAGTGPDPDRLVF